MKPNKNLQFKDIAICAPTELHPIIESELNNLNIETYCDSETSLFNLEPISYIFNKLKCCLEGKNKTSLISLINNSFCNLSSHYKNLQMCLDIGFEDIMKG